MINADLSDAYRAYIACLNRQDWPQLKDFVHDDVSYNGEPLGIAKYEEMLRGNFEDIPDASRLGLALPARLKASSLAWPSTDRR